MSARRGGAGRKQSSNLIRELVTILGSLSRTGERVTIGSIADRLGVDHDQATKMMEIVCQASGEDSGGLLISANDEFTEFTLQYPGVHGRPLRLNEPETIALAHALDVAAVPPDDPLRNRLQTSFWAPAVDDAQIRKSLGSQRDPELQRTLTLCARAYAQSRMIFFLYQGIADETPKERCALVRSLRLSSDNDMWYADSHDLDSLEERSFRLDRMSEVSVGPVGRLPTEYDQGSSSVRHVSVTFHDPTYLSLFDWPGLRITSASDNTTHATIPYYGERSDWLLRRIIACAGTMEVEDDGIMREACNLARNTLSDLQ